MREEREEERGGKGGEGGGEIREEREERTGGGSDGRWRLWGVEGKERRKGWVKIGEDHSRGFLSDESRIHTPNTDSSFTCNLIVGASLTVFTECVLCYSKQIALVNEPLFCRRDCLQWAELTT